MKKNLFAGLAIWALLILASCRSEPAPEVTATTFYETELFRQVQLAGVFEDSKTFVDLLRDAPFEELEQEYLTAREEPGFDLRAFVSEHFREAPSRQAQFETDTTRTMSEHISRMWDVLLRGPDPDSLYSSRIPLPYEYIVPGGRFKEIYYWDSYFTMLGLVADGREDLAENMLANFGHLIDSIGFIPNGTRDYYLTRSQPPFFSMMVALLAQRDSALLPEYLPRVEKEYAYWMEGASAIGAGQAVNRVVRLQGDTLMNRYWDSGRTPRPESYREDVELAAELATEAEKEALYANLRAAAASGWDFSSRWYEQEGEFASTQTTELLPVDLNCLMYFMEDLLAKGYRRQGEPGKASEMQLRAERRARLIADLFWDPGEEFFTDYDFVDGERTGEVTLAGTFPLYFGIASQQQAAAVRSRLLEDFLGPGGLVTTLKASGQQWDAPNGWAPLQWMAVDGLLRYGYTEEAVAIAGRWLGLNRKVYGDTGKMLEKYNVMDTTLLSGGGEYPTQDGFGWSNGVALGFRELLRKPEGSRIMPE
ncbi:trehalase family glycosidase [Robiginitalea sp. SC105]|uniref:trehalase family glycosidase n=1 Tax=Robiginitalea sp. SC105 TaxID=2762332 RepID=UPI00163AC7CD|nr:trehalase family glycosidase [Robiginitalea sp. SC105]MBC2838494.1 trehalase [Robiginitalea sp. SC105]